jgi:hypothetical protein
MLISLRDKLTCLNGMITLEAIGNLQDELAEYSQLQKPTITNRARSTVTSPA